MWGGHRELHRLLSPVDHHLQQIVFLFLPKSVAVVVAALYHLYRPLLYRYGFQKIHHVVVRSGCVQRSAVGQLVQLVICVEEHKGLCFVTVDVTEDHQKYLLHFHLHIDQIADIGFEEELEIVVFQYQPFRRL